MSATTTSATTMRVRPPGTSPGMKWYSVRTVAAMVGYLSKAVNATTPATATCGESSTADNAGAATTPEVIDALVYARLHRHGRLGAVAGSNAARLVVGSVLFVPLAFGGVAACPDTRVQDGRHRRRPRRPVGVLAPPGEWRGHVLSPLASSQCIRVIAARMSLRSEAAAPLV
ncbi:hypothetical protein ABZ816_41795 [Actinosynnema sp. NPDC047251]|uniref:Uncharacterized protein n=1 Tax=Saccharothrix espanaensis (strain ATCC 51144 / DSM 44229 / JCM 9112 / NBRC 15066 / NRRL 15764) TaxID=1179773 RepID=K0JQ50_SACES|nr:hypothetical protein [Saccharothrix espanaensis]CCH29415.1 hypothetical protein BN6_20940 [Saccharothrix espanaensis DSM 44229]